MIRSEDSGSGLSVFRYLYSIQWALQASNSLTLETNSKFPSQPLRGQGCGETHDDHAFGCILRSGDSRVAFDSFDLGKGSIGEKDYICLRNVVILVRSWVKAAQA
jgi:hypothetical protein